jgi:hypothetical protein
MRAVMSAGRPKRCTTISARVRGVMQRSTASTSTFQVAEFTSQKTGRAAILERLADRPDLPELLREGSLGEMWYSGILGGVPEER